jgi:DNA-binding Lrp family transcriptional regulator
MMATERLDRIDIKILAALQGNGRMTNAALADLVGLSASACLQRVKRLEDSGFIVGYRADIALEKLFETIIVFTQVTLRDHRADDFQKFERGIAAFPEVLECHLVSGGYDYLLKVTARSVADYQATIERILERNIGIEKYFSYIVIKSPFQGRKVPLAGLMEDHAIRR